MFKRFTSSLDIQLLEPAVFVGSNMDTSPVVRGTIKVTVSKSCMIQHLNLLVQGTLKTVWYEDTKSKSNTQTIVRDQLVLFPSTFPLLINAGSTQVPFEMPLPYGIPESIRSDQISVNYDLIAQIDFQRTDNPARLHKDTKTQLDLVRLPDSGMLGENLPVIIDSHKHFSHWCQYRISVNRKSAAIGSSLPVHVEIAPTTKGLKVKQIMVQILEKRTLNEKIHHSIYFLKPSNLHLPTSAITSPWASSLFYQIPEHITHSTHNYKYFHINHVLLFSLIVSIPNPKNPKKSLTKTIYFQTKIDLLDSRLSNLQQDQELPPYNCPISNEELEKLKRHCPTCEYTQCVYSSY